MLDKNFSEKVRKLVHLPEKKEPSKPKPVSEMMCLLLKMRSSRIFMYLCILDTKQIPHLKSTFENDLLKLHGA